MKICTKCYQEKSLDKFPIRKSSKDGYRNECKKCIDDYNKDYRNKNKEKLNLKRKEYYEVNRQELNIKTNKYQKTERGKEIHRLANEKYNRSEKGKQYHIQYYQEHEEERKQYHKKYYQKNKQELNKKQKEYRQTERGKEISKKANLKRKQNGKEYKYKKERRVKDPNFKLIINLRTKLNKVLKGINKSQSTINLLGCSIEDFKQCLEFLFEPGMSWENYGKVWNLDHYVPISYFDLKIEENQKICFNFLNLRPLWSSENFKKNNILPEDYLEHIKMIKEYINEKAKD